MVIFLLLFFFFILHGALLEDTINKTSVWVLEVDLHLFYFALT